MSELPEQMVLLAVQKARKSAIPRKPSIFDLYTGIPMVLASWSIFGLLFLTFKKDGDGGDGQGKSGPMVIFKSQRSTFVLFTWLLFVSSWASISAILVGFLVPCGILSHKRSKSVIRFASVFSWYCLFVAGGFILELVAGDMWV